MSSEFNAVPVREKYVDFNGKIKDNVPVVLADNRYLMSTTELFEQRMQGRRINRYVNTGDLIAYSGPKSDEQEIKFILSKHGFSLAGMGAASWAFARTPNMEWTAQSTIPLSEENGEKLGALVDELEENDEVQDVYTNAE